MKKLHLFLIILAVLLLSNLGLNVKEYFEMYEDDERPRRRKRDLDQYILKSEVVPPVCPKCPDASVCPRQKECPACPPCGRCPEPAFTCEKVPNYSSRNDSYLPRPVLDDFSQFGM